ncbi:acetate uptake transporter [Streptomyces montanisoli]|uniref:acetate uptake transporter n=1 Tax=Streptomyces montanisoli TaxID=2798581 RepID=UPI0027DBFDED|nr:acetate uptake transporter [Streptomyces montanisoli]
MASAEPKTAAGDARPPAPPASTETIADPGALGLAGFAMTTFVLSAFNAGLLSDTLETVVLPLALFYGGLAQLLAGMWEFRRANTFAATAFSSYGAFWIGFAYYITQVAPKLPAAHAYQATGLFLLAWAIFTTYMIIPAMRTSGAVLAVIALLALTYILLTIGAFAQSTGIDKVGGWVGFVTAVVAWYASCASAANSTWKRTVLPVWPLG